jgi:hypothetical protein
MQITAILARYLENSLAKRIYDASDVEIGVYFFSFSIKKFLNWEGSSIHS